MKRTISKDQAMQDYLDRLDTIIDDDIRAFVKEALDDASDEFWTAQGSVSGINHPPEDNIVCGLLVHVTKAMEVAEELFRFFGVDDEVDRDIVRAAVMIHDTWKQGSPWGNSTHREHGLICAEMIEKYTLDPYIKRKIQKCISSHMSRWAWPFSALASFIIPDKLQMVVALADYMASRNNVSFYPGRSIIDK